MVWRSLFAWITKRSMVEPGALELPYIKAIRTILWVFVGLSALEVPIMDLILRPWPWIRYPFLVLGIWGVVYMIGFVAAYEKLPHTLTDDALTLRAGPLAEYRIPRELISGLKLDQQSYESNKSRQVLGNRFALLMAGSTSVTVELSSSIPIEHRGQVHQIDSVSFYLDDPAPLRQALKS